MKFLYSPRNIRAGLCGIWCGRKRKKYKSLSVESACEKLGWKKGITPTLIAVAERGMVRQRLWKRLPGAEIHKIHTRWTVRRYRRELKNKKVMNEGWNDRCQHRYGGSKPNTPFDRLLGPRNAGIWKASISTENGTLMAHRTLPQHHFRFAGKALGTSVFYPTYNNAGLANVASICEGKITRCTMVATDSDAETQVEVTARRT